MIAAWMLYAAVVGTLLGLGALALERVLRQHALPSRWLWAACMVLSVGWPLGHLWTQAPPTPAPGLSAESPTAMTRPASDALLPTSLRPEPITVPVSAASLLRRLDRPILTGWALMTGVLLVFFIGLLVRTRHLRRLWRRGELGGRAVLFSDEWGPAVVGILRPQIVLPRWCQELEERALAFVLDHELEHIRAGDLRLILAAGALPLLFPWHLPLWWQMSRLRTAVEGDCDLRVLGRDPARTEPYLRLLLEIGARSPRRRVLAAMISEPYATLRRRIRIMTMPLPRKPWVQGGLLAAVGLLLVSLACWTPGPTNAADDRTVPPAADRTSGTAASQTAPVFTPYTVRPDIANLDQVRTALQEGYPPRLRDAGIGGTVEVWYFIDEEGLPQRTQVNRSSGQRELDMAALRVAEILRFNPALNRDQEREVWVALPVVFTPGSASEATVPETVPAAAPAGRGGANAAFATASGEPGSIVGSVTAAVGGGSVSGAQIYLPGTGRGTLSGADGRFRIEGIPPGEWEVVVELIGYEQIAAPVTVTEGQPAEVGFSLEATAVPLAPLIIAGKER